MTNKEKQDWLKDNYPLTIVTDRYSGTYSDGYYLAFPLDYDEIPEDVNRDDMTCSSFWETYKEPVGKGSSVQAAIDDLISQMKSNVIIDVPFGAQDSELKGWEYTIPKGMFAEIKDGKIIVKQKAINDEVVDTLIKYFSDIDVPYKPGLREKCIAFLDSLRGMKMLPVFDSNKAIGDIFHIEKDGIKEAWVYMGPTIDK